MGKTRKREMRRNFREAVFERDGYRCVVCGFESSPERAQHELDAHHITPRGEMPNGGYVKENGVSLCDAAKQNRSLALRCHYKAELVLQGLSIRGDYQAERTEHEPFAEFTPKALYKAIGSSYEKAVEASEYLR